MRTLIDRAGVAWDVYEVYPSVERRAVSRVPDQYRSGCASRMPWSADASRPFRWAGRSGTNVRCSMRS